MRVELDQSDNSFNKKIREAVTRKIPNMVIIGHKEAEESTITLRRYCAKEQATMSLDTFVERMKRAVSNRIMDNFADVDV
jgi:threonyl-tRNA synthetase